MKQKKLTAILAAMTLALSASAAAMPAVSAADYTANKARVSVHDPSVFKDENTGTYYVFGSHIDAAKSSDLQNWRSFTNGYATTNNVLFGNLSQSLKKPFAWAGENLEDCAGGFSVWAPDVIWNPDYINTDGSKGAYLMYFCTSSTYIRSVIGFAVSKNVEGPYTCVDTLIYSGFTKNDQYVTSSTKNVNKKYTSTNIPELISSGQVTMNNSWFSGNNFNNQLFPNAIDPTIYYGTDGRMYMCYGSWSGGIFSLEIDKATGKCIHPKTGTTADGRMVDSYFGTKISGGYGKSGEGPFIEYNADTGYYYLWVTYGGLTSNDGYNMRVGRAKDPLGPYTDPSGKNMVLPTNPDLNSVGLKVMTNYKFSSLERAYMACGHNSVLRDDDGQWYLLNHARFDDGSEFHQVRVHAMNFNEAGWPVVMPYEYSGEEWSENGFEPASLTGTYEFINHGSGTDGKITTASKIALNADGSISGAVTGTWHESDDSAAADFTVGNVTYHGFFNPQYDETGKGSRVMTFTAVGNNNQTIWGAGTSAWNGTERSAVKFYTGSGQLRYDENAAADSSGNVYIGETKLLSNVPYTITNVNSGLVLETASGKAGDGLQQWAKRGNKSGDKTQDFRITDLGNGWCRITPMTDETLCVAVNEISAENGIDTGLQTFTGAENQLWKLEKSGSYYGITSKCANGAACLDVYEWSKENGGVVKQWEFWGGECQLWKITPTYAAVPAGAYTLRNLNSGLFVNAADDALMQSADAKVWNLKPQDGYFTVSDASGRTVTAADSTDGAALTLRPYTGDENQLFAVKCNADGSYALLSKVSGEAAGFDVYEISKDAGAKIIQWNYRSDVGQKFILAPAEAEEIIVTTTSATTTTATTTTTTVTTTTVTATTVSDTKDSTLPDLISFLRGDVNDDGMVDVKDAVLLARYVGGDVTAYVNERGLTNADCDLNGNIHPSDLTLLLRFLARLTDFPEA